MFDIVHKNKRLVQVILAIAILPFAFFGIESNLTGSGADGNYVSTVNGEKISQQEYGRALKDQQERLRNLLKENIRTEQLNSPELRASVLESLIRKHLLLRQAEKSGLAITDARLQAEIVAVTAFQDDGKFSRNRYETLLRNQNMTPILFEERLRQDLLQEQLSSLYSDAGFTSKTSTEHLLRLVEQQREISQSTLASEQFINQVKLDPAAPKTYYESNQTEFRVPDQARVEYLVLSLDALLSATPVSQEELKKSYEEHKTQLQQNEERQASHILIAVPTSASAAAKEEARKKAENISKEARGNPALFPTLAKKYSQDTDSAERGGDLGIITRGMSQELKPIEDAVFAMQLNEVSAPVQSSFGYHIVKLNAIKNAQQLSFEQAKSQLEPELKKQKATKRFAELAENFNNLVYEQSDSLQPAAEALKLTVQRSDLIAKNGAGAGPLLGNARLLQSIFSEESIQNKRNTEAIEVAPNTLVSAHVVEYKPASTRPFEEVSKAIVVRLTKAEARKLAISAGQAKLDLLRQGKNVGITWSAAQTVTRERPQDLNVSVLQQAFKTNAAKIPAYSGIETPQGYTLVKISRIIDSENIPAERRQAFSIQLWQLSAQDEFASYLASLRQKADVTTKPEQPE